MTEQSPPAWHPDPHQTGRERYWDGRQWTDQYRDATTHAPIQVAATAVPQPVAGAAKPKRQHTVLKVTLGVVLGFCLLIGGCAALVGVGLNTEQTDGITRAEFDSIAQGTSQSSIEDRLGAPEDKQEFESQIPELQDEPSSSSCIYYPEKGKKILEGASFQLCFDDGRLTSKNAY